MLKCVKGYPQDAKSCKFCRSFHFWLNVQYNRILVKHREVRFCHSTGIQKRLLPQSLKVQIYNAH